MLRTPVAEALGAASAASEIRIGGWVRTRRDAKGFSFLELNDGSCLGNIQCIVDEGTADMGGVYVSVEVGFDGRVDGDNT